MGHPPDSVSRCRELISVAVSQIDGDPIVGDRLVDPALEITVAHFKKIIALQRPGRRNPMTHENAEDLTANILVGRSVKHRSPKVREVRLLAISQCALIVRWFEQLSPFTNKAADKVIE